MSMLRTPHTVKTRRQLMMEHLTGPDAKYDNQCDKNSDIKPENPIIKNNESNVGSTHTNTSRCASVMAAQKKRIEFEAAQEKARIELELEEKKKNIEIELIEKKVAAQIAELESHSRSSGKRSVNSFGNSKVIDWLDKSAVALEEKKHHRHSSLDGAMRDVTALNDKEVLTRLAVSKDLPPFFGDPMEWLHFKEAFQESTRLCQFSEMENMWRLRKCLRGEAKEATSSLLISGCSPQEIMDTLELRFGRPECIMRKIVSQLKYLQPLPQAYHTKMVDFAIKVKNCVASIKAIKQQDYLRSPEQVSTIISKLPTVLLTKWAEYIHSQGDNNLPKLEILSKFLYDEATKIAASGVSYIHGSAMDSKKMINTKSSVLLCHSNTSEPCNFCRTKNHNLDTCGKFKRALRKDRWRFVRTNKLCFKCLGSRHSDISNCKADNCNVDGCGLPHHRLLHWVPVTRQQEQPAEAVERPVITDEIVSNVNQTNKVPKVFLKIVPVTVHGPSGSIHAHALLDDGATVSLISADLANKVGLHGKSYTMCARSAWDSGQLVCKSEIVSFNISSASSAYFSLSARKINQLNLPLQSFSNIDITQYEKLINNCINFCNCNIQPKVLIGQDNYDIIKPTMCLSVKTGGPFITQTPLGYCLHGNLQSVSQFKPFHSITQSAVGNDDVVSMNSLYYSHTDANLQPVAHAHAFTSVQCYDSDKQMHDLIKQSFCFDNLGIKPRQNPDDLRAITILDNTSKLINGQWTVGLPWKFDSFKMPDSYSSALNRLNSVKNKMLRNTEYSQRYCERVRHLFENNYAREVIDSETSDHIWYLPHFGVDNPNKKKLRLVFDSSAKANKLCLNDFLLQGPDLLQSLYGILFRFRENRIGVIGDIKDMFLRIKIRSEDQHALRFLWQEPNQPVKKHVMTSLIFGANCSPFIAQYINQNKNASRFKQEMPDAVSAIQNNQYMDDYIDSLTDENNCIKMINKISYIHQQGGFEMRNWSSNVPAVLQNIPKETLSTKAIGFNIDNKPERTLGLLWFPSTDELAFDLSLKRIPLAILNLENIPTKREMLRIIMSILDIHGFLSPFMIKAKILMRETWKLNIQWDEKINSKLNILFCNWIQQLQEINKIRIPRWYFHNFKFDVDASETTIELHLFCDGSPSAYAAVAYWRKVFSDGSVAVSFVASKCKISPIKQVTIPRLELQAALLSCRLGNSIKTEHRIKPNTTYYWCDSTTVLHWIKNPHRNYKTFVANRLGEIDELSHSQEWHYVPTALNIADIATKASNYQLNNNCEWFSGPSFLHEDQNTWPRQPETKEKISPEILECILTTQIDNNALCELPVPEPIRFSNWMRLLRATAYVFLFIEKCKKSKIKELNIEILNKSENMLLRYSQMKTFSKEISSLKLHAEVQRDSRLRTLTPYIDKYSLLRVGSRIGAAQDIDAQTKFPVILDGQDYISRLIIMDYHIKAAHSCNEMVVNELRQKFWILRLRPTVRTVAARCLICRIKKTVPTPPHLGDLPESRLAHHKRPFTMCGVDLFGPIDVAVGRQRQRRYGVMFTCMTVRAIHLELVPSLTADSMIMALRRMAARRGWPHTLLSDNGTNFKAADKELKKACEEIDQITLSSLALSKGVTWKFIPPGSPHMGGAWERLIRSVKTALKVVLKERAPREEVLITLLAEVENMVNSRPLTHVSVDPRSCEALTPNHFLIGGSSNLPLPGNFDDGDLCLRKQWRISQRLADMFWSRWVKEYLPTLIPRPKWCSDKAQLKVGDLVVIADPTSTRNCWPRGVIKTVYPGSDGRVRVVDVKTKSGVMKRPVTRVAALFSDECRSRSTAGEDVSDERSPANL